jgi:hypothetical protein
MGILTFKDANNNIYLDKQACKFFFTIGARHKYENRGDNVSNGGHELTKTKRHMMNESAKALFNMF